MSSLDQVYVGAVSKIKIRPFDMEAMKKDQQHKKFVASMARQVFMGLAVMILCVSVLSVSAVAAVKAIQRYVFTGSAGFVIDERNLLGEDSEVSDMDIAINYSDILEDTDTADINSVESSEEVEELPVKCTFFDTWESAVDVIDFPVSYPENVAYESLQIAYQDDRQYTGIESVAADYISGESELVINYTSYVNTRGWSSSHHYNGETYNPRNYKNSYGYCFSLVDNIHAESKEKYTFAVIAFDWYEVQVEFKGYEEAQIESILDQMDLSIYEE